MEGVLSADPEFCTFCGSILPVPTGTALDNQCYVCQESVDSKQASSEVIYIIHFNEPDVYSKEQETSGSSKKSKGKGKPTEEVAEGPVVDRECRKCGHLQMSYATLQLRSADEGQTVFYTCMNPVCKFKESENS